MAKWFYKLKGDEKGPVASQEIRKLIENGQLNKSSYIRQKDSEEWHEIKDVKEFDRRGEKVDSQLHHIIDLPKDVVEPDSEKLWVLLKKEKSKNEVRFKQSGPFTTDQIMKKVVHGKAEFSDHVWQDGMTRWHRIGDLQEFDRRNQENRIDEKTTDVNSDLPDLATTKELKDDAKSKKEDVSGRDEDLNDDTYAKTFPDLSQKTFASELTDATSKFLNSVVTKVKSDLKKATQELELPPDEAGPELTEMPVEEELLVSLSQRKIEDPREEEKPKVPPPLEEKTEQNPPKEASSESSPAEDAESQTTPNPKASSKEKSVEDKDKKEGKGKKKKRKKRKMKEVEPKNRAEKLRSIRRTQSTVAILMLAAMILLGWNIFQFINKKEVKKAKKTVSKGVQPVKKSIKPPVKKTKSAASPVKPTVAKKKAKKPEMVKDPNISIQFQNLKSPSARIIVKSNAADQQKIYVTIRGKTGNVLESPSFLRSITLTKESKKDTEVDLSRFAAPDGQYVALVESGNTSTERSFFYGKNDSIFQSRMRLHLKQISFRQQLEKKQLYYITKAQILRLNRFLKRIDREKNDVQWRRFYRGWSIEFNEATSAELNNYNYKTSNFYAYPEYWSRLIEFRKDIKTLAKKFSRSNSAALRNKYQTKISVISANLGDLKSKVSRLSVRKPN